jgi:hypothetical protein
MIADWARYSPQNDFWIANAILIILAVNGFFGAFYFFSRKRLMENTPTSRIRSAAQGFVELEGRGVLLEGPPIIAPLTGTICTWYRYSIEELRRSGKKSSWVTLRSGQSNELFLLVDDTGECIVDPEGARVTPSGKDIWYGNSPHPDSKPRPGARSKFSIQSGRYRYTEERLHLHDKLYAIGLFNTVGGAGSEFDAAADVRAILREWKQDSQALLEKFDRNRDGNIDVEEWQVVRDEALLQIHKKHAETSTATPVNVLSRTTDRRRSYIISAVPQNTLIKRFNHYSVALMILFFLSGTSTAWLIAHRLAG